MADQQTTTGAPRKQRRWQKTLAWILGIFLVLIVVVYFVGTSSAFFKGVILPRVGKTINSEVTVSDASISPFKSVVLHDLKVQPKGQEPLLTVKEVRLRYSLMAMMRGNIDIQEVFVASPVINLVENPDGSQNLDPIMDSMEEKGKAEPEEQKPSEPMKLNIQKVRIADGVIRTTTVYQGGTRDVTELSPVNVTLQDLRNGATGKLVLDSGLRMENNPPAPDGPGALQGSLKGNFDVGITAEGMPGVIQGKSTLVVTKASGTLEQATGFSTDLSCDITPQEVKQILVSLHKGQVSLGELKATGPLDMNKLEGRLAVDLTGVDSKLLNMVGASSGLDFGPTKIFSTNQVQISNTGSVYTVVGRFVVDQMTVTQTNQTTPRLDFASAYHLTVNNDSSTALLRTLELSGKQNGVPFLSGNLSSPMTLAWGETSEQAVSDSTLNLVVTNFNLADWKPFMGNSISGGSVNSLVQVASTKGGTTQAIKGTANLANLSGSFGETSITNLGFTLDMDITMDTDLVRISKVAAALSQAGQAGGNFLLTGTYNRSNEVAQIQGQVRDLNQNGLRSFLEPMLSGQQLVSVAINGDFSAGYNPEAASDVKAKVKVTNLVVRDPQQKTAPTPLTAMMQFDAGLQNDVADLRQAQLVLPATDRATNNSVNVTGRVDMSNTNAIQGQVKLLAETLDLTGYYDVLMGRSEAEAAKPPPGTISSAAPAAPAATEPEKEPEAMILPVTNFVAEAAIRRLYVREIEITNLQATTRMNGGRVQINPAQMALNGAPVSATVDLDLGVEGWKYDLKFQAKDVPFAPLVNTYAPERKGQMSGTLTAEAALLGRGTTDSSLQKNLSGNFYFGTTNLNLSVQNVKSPLLKAIIHVIAIVPELRKNPTAALGSLTSSLFGRGSTAESTGGWGGELSRSPIDIIQAKATIGDQKMNLENAFLQSPAFQAEAKGVVELANILTNSVMNIPLTIKVQRSLAEKINFVPAGTPTNVAYVALPNYVTLKGKISDPTYDINKTAILGTALEQLGGRIPGVDQKTGNLIQGLGGILSGRRPAGATNEPTTNAPSPGTAPQTNSPPGTSTNTPVGNLLDLLRKK